MANNYFQFKQFRIQHDKCAMKVNTDGVLLGAWATAKKPKNTLDIGTGSGLIALMLAQRFEIKITAIEIDPQASRQAKENIQKSKWANNIMVVNTSFQDFWQTTDSQYDFIVCNPPYFANSLKTNNKARDFARHNDSLSNSELLEGVTNILSPDGTFSLILPTQEAKEFIEEAKHYNLFISKELHIKPTPQKPTKRILIELSRIKKNSNIKKETIVIENGGRHNFSEEYKTLTRDFYLVK